MRLDVPVHKPQVVQRAQRVRSLGHVECGVSLAQRLRAAGEKRGEVAARAQLHH